MLKEEYIAGKKDIRKRNKSNLFLISGCRHQVDEI
jgi:hypothetical protein